jgi:hypothetical protein
MQLTTFFVVGVTALASTTAARPHFSLTYRGDHIAIHQPTNSTSAYNATTTGTQGKTPLSTGSAENEAHTNQAPVLHPKFNQTKVNHCHALC